MTLIVSRLNLAWRMRVTFDEKTGAVEYLTPDVRKNDPGWGGETFNHTIRRLEFFLPTGHRILLEGMEQYNFFVEAVQSMSRKASAQIEAFWLCGKLPLVPLVELWRVGNGRIIHDQKPWKREWGGSATTGWKRGAPGEPLVSILTRA